MFATPVQTDYARMVAATSHLYHSLTQSMQAEEKKTQEAKERFGKKKSEGQVAHSNCFTWTRSATWEEWLLC